MSSFCVNIKDDDIDLPSLYWIPKLHKDPYKQRCIAGSSSSSTKPLSRLLTSILTTVKEGLKKYCNSIFSHSGINQMWILKNSKELLDNLQSHSLNSIHSIKTYDFSTLYTTISHTKLKARLSELIKNAFRCINGKKRFGTVFGDMNLNDLLGSIARVGYHIVVPDFYLVLHGLRYKKKHCGIIFHCCGTIDVPSTFDTGRQNNNMTLVVESYLILID